MRQRPVPLRRHNQPLPLRVAANRLHGAASKRSESYAGAEVLLLSENKPNKRKPPARPVIARSSFLLC